MRISDWSSDVCSSDLPKWLIGQFAGLADPAAQLVWRAGRSAKNAKSPGIRYCGRERRNTCPTHSGQKDRVFDPENFANAALERSAERRVGKGCVSTGRSRWSPFN